MEKSIEELLRLWGAWAANSGINLKLKPLMMYQAATPAPKARAQMNDEQAEVFDPAMCLLRIHYPELYEILYLHYVKLRSIRAIATDRNTSIGGIHQRITIAKHFVEGFLCGFVAAGEKIIACSERKAL